MAYIYSHWRLKVPVGGTYVQMAEVAFLGASDVDLSVGGTPTASSTFSGAYLPSAAFDKNNSTEWASVASDPDAWLQYQHASAVDVAKVSIRWSANAAYLPANASLLASNSDAGPWVALMLVGPAPAAGTTAVYTVTEPIPPELFGMGSLGVIDAFAPEPAPPWHLRPLGLVPLDSDMIHGGPGRVHGTVAQKADPANVPLVRRVRLHREVDGMALRETWSASDGTYTFTGLALGYTYTVIAYDHAHDYRAVVADNLTPEVLP